MEDVDSMKGVAPMHIFSQFQYISWAQYPEVACIEDDFDYMETNHIMQ